MVIKQSLSKKFASSQCLDLHILHVDDDASFLEVSKEILRTLCTFKVETALSIDEAFKKLDTDSFDAIISDYQFPEKNGLVFLKTLKRKGITIPVIFFTGKGTENVALNALNLGAKGYCNKQGSPETVYRELIHIVLSAVEREKTKNALIESEKRYRTLIEQAPEPIFVCDLKGKILDVNHFACKHLNYTKDELLAQNLTDLDSTLSSALLCSVVAKKRLTFESYQKSKNGHTIPVDVTVGSMTLDNEVVAILFVRDITERKVLETRLRELAYKLNNVSPGDCLISVSHERMFKTYSELTLHGIPGLCIVREDPKKIADLYGIKTNELILLSSREIAAFTTLSDLQAVSLAISEFLRENKNGVVLLDGLEYLVSVFGFNSVYMFIQEKRFDFLAGGALLLVPINMDAFSDKEAALLTSELRLFSESPST